jgi:hypothetical protein
MLEEMVYHDSEHGIDDTCTRVVGMMVAQDQPLLKIVSTILPNARHGYNRDRLLGDPPWEDQHAIARITNIYKRFNREGGSKSMKTILFFKTPRISRETKQQLMANFKIT